MDKDNKRPGSADRKPTDFNDDGVIYDLSTGKKLAQSTTGKDLKNKKKKFDINSKYAVFYIVAILMAIILAVVLFSVTLQRMRDNPPPSIASPNLQTTNTPDSPIFEVGLGVNVEQEEALVGIIQHIDTLNRIFTIHDISESDTYILNVTGSTDLRDRFGQGLVFAEFSLGDIVSVSFTPSNSTLTSVQVSNQTWERRLVSGLEVNSSTNIITIDGSAFNYTDQLKVLNNGISYNLNNLNPLSVITMRGINNTVWFIDVERGVGSIGIINSGHIVNGSIEISRTTSRPLEENPDANVQEIYMQEGSHRIVVRGDNISPYTREVVVNNAETTILDLSDVSLTIGNLNITTNVPTATIEIDGEPMDFYEPISLDFGVFTVSASAPGYEPFEAAVTINSANHHLAINLVEVVVNASVEIRSIPAGADVFIDNSLVGITPITAVAPRGTRSLTLRREGYQTVTMNIDVGGSSIPYLLELQPVIPPPPAAPEPVTPEPAAPPELPAALPASPAPVELLDPPVLPSVSGQEDNNLSFIPGPGQ